MPPAVKARLTPAVKGAPINPAILIIVPTEPVATPVVLAIKQPLCHFCTTVRFSWSSSVALSRRPSYFSNLPIASWISIYSKNGKLFQRTNLNLGLLTHVLCSVSVKCTASRLLNLTNLHCLQFDSQFFTFHSSHSRNMQETIQVRLFNVRT